MEKDLHQIVCGLCLFIADVSRNLLRAFVSSHPRVSVRPSVHPLVYATCNAQMPKSHVMTSLCASCSCIGGT